MKSAAASALVLLALVAVSACDSYPASLVNGPSTLSTPMGSVILDSLVSPRQVVPLSSCPSIAPFLVPVTLNVTAGASPITLRSVQIQATDPFRVQSPPTIFDSASLTRRFGSTTIDSFNVRAFPFTHTFGCGMSGNIVLHMLVTTLDGSGLEHLSTLQMSVR